jgi:hypothetical protein
MTQKKINASKYHAIGSPRISRRGRSSTGSTTTPSTKPAGMERTTMIALILGCAVLLYMTELLISSNSSQDSLSKKLLPRFRKFEYFPNPAPSSPPTVAMANDNLRSILPKQTLREESSKRGDDAQLLWPTAAPTLPSITDIEAYFAATNTYPDEKYIALMPGKKTGIRQDRRVVFENFSFEPYTRPEGIPTNIRGRPRALLAAESDLLNHPLSKIPKSTKRKSLDDTIEFIQRSETCVDKAIFLTMATVGDDLYWQLIENFVYTMVKYHVSDCSLVICVSDPRCMEMCAASYFPCYEYLSEVVENALANGKTLGNDVVIPSVMEQIAEVKLVHIPKALSKNVRPPPACLFELSSDPYPVCLSRSACLC